MEAALERALAALHAYYTLGANTGFVTRRELERAISDVVQSLQSILIAQAALDPVMKAKVRDLLVVAKASTGRD